MIIPVGELESPDGPVADEDGGDESNTDENLTAVMSEPVLHTSKNTLSEDDWAPLHPSRAKASKSKGSKSKGSESKVAMSGATQRPEGRCVRASLLHEDF